VLVQNLGLPRDPVAAARALLKARTLEVPLGHISCGGEGLYFAMSAGVGGHAAMMRAAYRYHKHRTGRLAYFASGIEVLATHPLADFALEITATSGEERSRRACELIAVRVNELNMWRTGGGLERPSLRVTSVEGASRLRLARAAFDSLILQTGGRRNLDNTQSAAIYEDAVIIRITPAPSTQLALQADGEIVATVTSASPAVIAMSAESAVFLSNKV
jgi:diacylglycerol kinase family enzyme